MYGCERWTIKKAKQRRIWCFQTVVLEKTLESPLNCKEIKPVNAKGNQPWIFIGRTDAEAEAKKLWPSDAKSWLTGKYPDAGKDWGWDEKGTTEMAGWHHWLIDMSLNKLHEIVKDREAWCATVHSLQRVRHNWVTEHDKKLGKYIVSLVA